MTSYAIYRIAETMRVLLFMTLSILVFNFYPVTAVMIYRAGAELSQLKSGRDARRSQGPRASCPLCDVSPVPARGITPIARIPNASSRRDVPPIDSIGTIPKIISFPRFSNSIGIQGKVRLLPRRWRWS